MNTGYGNCSPGTDGGRAVVLTFGFLCILLFATLLGRAGVLMTTIYSDFVERHQRMKWLSVPWVAVILWGTLLYVWLLVIAEVTVAWKQRRMGQDMPLADGFWFAFISITTVGLGDLYLDHETIAFYDVVGFAMVFLVGFVLLANFLVVLVELVKSLGHHNNLRFSARLQEQSPY